MYLRPFSTRRRFFFFLTLCLVVLSFRCFEEWIYKPSWLSFEHPGIWYSGGKLVEEPPNYEKLRQWERRLPQHNLDLPFPEGKSGRYVKFSNQIKALGWNNVLNEVLLCAHLAYASQRAYVFQDYQWKPEYYPWRISVPFWRKRPNWPRTPLNALISGPTSGGEWEAGDLAPRSISEEWFDVVCPVKDRLIIVPEDVKPALRDASADEIFAHWKKILLDAPERCVEVREGRYKEEAFPQVFDLWVIGNTRILPIWDSFSKSPTSRLLGTSPLVESAIERSEYLFNPQGPRPPHPSIRDPYQSMMALHIRRGDFKKACFDLAAWNSTFYGWNLLPFLPDKFTPPPGGSWGINTPENIEKYMMHCLPSFESIMQKVRDSRAAYVSNGKGRRLDVIFLLTNAEKGWLEKLTAALKADGWYTIVTSKDLKLDREQNGVNMAVDMDIARRAAVFIGNGWSSFTSNIIHRRLVDGKEHISNRFW